MLVDYDRGQMLILFGGGMEYGRPQPLIPKKIHGAHSLSDDPLVLCTLLVECLALILMSLEFAS